ncbi:MAG: Cyclopropane-fatty-acyl-phospholipid synthase [Solirubrobacterales bacterium]|nr:Cyclopropane-fatty-acyl-phospholipid synthase [Solirubrobacterales bacterium]
MLATTAPLRSALTRALPDRPFTVELWDGSRVPATAPDAPTFTLRSPQAVAHVVRSPGELGIGRAYVAGLIDVDDMDAALGVVTGWRPPALDRGERARLALAAVRAAGLTRPPRVPEMELRQEGVLHSVRRDRSAIAYHYNAGNAFFQLFLDPSMTYSCAIFSRGASTLEEAQETKLELVATKLALTAGERVLDVGCGWGAFAIHAARHHGVQVLGITLSEEQATLARERVKEAGLQDQVQIRLADYRELDEEPFDAISSIGMVEHVGEAQIDVYARQLHRLLRPGGRLLNHGIAQLQRGEFNKPGPFSERYVFPDGETQPLSRVELALERAGFVTDHVEGFGADYAQTLRHWIERYEARYDEAVALTGAERARVWRIYLRAARNGFENGYTSIYQVRCSKPDTHPQTNGNSAVRAPATAAAAG